MMQIFVKPYYRTLTLTVKPSDTVAIVKSMIQTKLSNEEAIPSFKMTLAYAGKLLHDERILSDYCIANQATLAYGINMSAAEPPSDTEGPQVLCIQYPAERKAFSSDCFYKVRPSDTLGDLKMLVLAREGIVCTRFCEYDDDDVSDDTDIGSILGSFLYSNSKPATLHVTHFSRRARASRNVTRLAMDLLREVLSYSDLRALAACASTCRVLRDAVPPKLAHELVLAQFPILTTIVDVAKPMPSARELFESQSRLFDDVPSVSPTHSLDEYVFSLELTVSGSKHVGTGVVLDGTAEAQICFSIPKALWDVEHHDDTVANVMATRKGTLRRAALYSGDVEDGDGSVLYFEWNRIPSKNGSMQWIGAAANHQNQYYKPLICLEWKSARRRRRTKLTATFKWDSDDQAEDMSLEDACLVLEHWCKL